MSLSVEPESISLILQIVIFFMLILGLPLARGVGNKKNLIRHGYLTTTALIIHTILVITAMIYLQIDGLLTLANLPLFNSVFVVSHIILGTAALVLGFIIAGFWASKALGNMNCIRAKKIMIPTLIIWAISLVMGYIIHFSELF
jgi:hypothetical protein